MRLGTGAELTPAEPGRLPANRYAWYAGAAALGLTADLATKGWVFSRLGLPSADAPTIDVVAPYLEWQTSLNEGALFGLGAGWQPLFAMLALLAAGFIVWWLFVAGNARSLLLTIALGGVTAGILGNLYDRLGAHGLRTADGRGIYAVRDWIHFQIPKLGFDWPNFNIADSLLVIGASVLVWQAMTEKPARESPTHLAATSSGA